MKKIVKILAVVLVIGTMVCIFASCGSSLKGTYKSTDVDSANLSGSLTFDKDSKVTGSLKGGLGTISIDGTYAIEDGNITFTYEVFGVSASKAYTFEKKGGSIFIDGAEFVKEK